MSCQGDLQPDEKRVQQSGQTLIELVAVLVILVILITSAAPSLGALIENRRLAGATQAVRNHVQFARSEAIKQNRAMAISFEANGGEAWRLGIRPQNKCEPAQTDPTHAQACVMELGDESVFTVLDSTAYPGVSLTRNRTLTRFEPVRGTSMGTNVTLTLQSRGGKEARVIVSNIGRIRTCSPSGPAKLPGQPDC